MTRSKFFLGLVGMVCWIAASGQEVWTVEECVKFAVEHNHDVRIRSLSLDNKRAERLSAIGSFLPSIGAGTSAQENFGRAIDPETNTYTNITTFYQGMSLSASLPLFDGLSRLHQLQAARAGVLLGRTQLEIRKDEVALAVVQAYADALYYQGTAQLAEEKLAQSREQLRQTEVMVEVGRKSEADAAQMRATVASDEVEATRQGNLRETAMLNLKKEMNYPSPTLCPPSQSQIAPLSAVRKAKGHSSSGPCSPTGGGSFKVTIDNFINIGREETNSKANYSSPSPCGEGWGGVIAAQLSVSIAQRQLRIARSYFVPSLSLSAGTSTTYFKSIGHTATPYGRQARDNAGRYFSASLSVPIFSRLQNISNLRRQKNNLSIAREELAKQEDELVQLRLQAACDCEGLRKEITSWEQKVEADSLALSLTEKQYEEGLASPIDVRTSSLSLLQSRASLLRAQLLLTVKEKYRNYYEGESVWTK